VGERKRKIGALKRYLLGFGIEDVTHWKRTQFKIEGMLFIIRNNASRYELVARKKCMSCKAQLDSFSITNLLDLGRVLANEHGWAYHECQPKRQPVASRVLTNEEKVYNLVAELVELVTKEPTSRVV